MNAREEFLRNVRGKARVKCVCIYTESGEYDANGDWTKSYKVLKVGYTPKEYEQFLKELNFEYSNGYGGQELFGEIWLEDGTWFDRGEYDGSEWWVYQACPPIDELCKYRREND